MDLTKLLHQIANKITKSKSKSKQESEQQVNKRLITTKDDVVVEKIYCRFCGKPNLSTQEFCTMCGNNLNPPPSTIMKACTKCGLAMNDDSIFCASCGTRFEEDM
jgi:RNA polymerase subunit RPABC4/transcription elongation factor Spt4